MAGPGRLGVSSQWGWRGRSSRYWTIGLGPETRSPRPIIWDASSYRAFLDIGKVHENIV